MGTMSPLIVVGSVLAVLAGLVHVYIFVLESLRWSKPSTMRTFGVRSAADAETTRALAYNQGFYNLFLALGAFAGVALLGVSLAVGATLVLFATLSMLLAALVLITSNRRMLRAAAIQGALPLLAALAITLALLA